MSSIFDKINEYKDSNKVAIHFKGRDITYGELCENVLKMANYFINIGIKKGDIVTLVLPNIPTCVYSIYALNYIGAKTSILHFLTRLKEVNDKMDFTGSKYAIIMNSLFQGNNDFIKNSDKTFIFANPLKHYSWFKRLIYYFKGPSIKKSKNVLKLDEFTKTKIKIKEFNNLSANETSFLIHSGGTTDIPKTIELSNNAVNNISINLNVEIIDENDKTLAVLPVFHCFGLCVGIHAFLNIHASIYLMDKFNAKEVINGINNDKINMIIGVPNMMRKIIEDESFKNCKIEKLHECFIGAESLTVSLINEFNKIIKDKDTEALICEGYGLTETSSVVIVNTQNNYKIGSLGMPIPNVNVKILDENNNVVKKTKEVGEICIAGNTLMNGYFNNQKATEEAFTYIDGKKYLKTGDLGYIDKDGFVFFKERRKRVFKISGVSIYPNEIENIVLKFVDIIKEASLECSTNDNGKPFLILFVVKKNTTKTDDEIVNLIVEKIQKKTIKYNWPSKIIFLDNLPKTKAGKIDHNALVSKIK